MRQYFLSQRDKCLSSLLSFSLCFSSSGIFAQNSTQEPSSPVEHVAPPPEGGGDGSSSNSATGIVVAFTFVTGIIAILGFGVAIYQLATRSACPLNKGSANKTSMLSIVKSWLFKKVQPAPFLEGFIDDIFERGDEFRILSVHRDCCGFLERVNFAGVVLHDKTATDTHVHFVNIPRLNMIGHRIDASHSLTRLDAHPETWIVGRTTVHSQVDYTGALNQAQLEAYKPTMAEGLRHYVDLFIEHYHRHEPRPTSWTVHLSLDMRRLLFRVDESRKGILIFAHPPQDRAAARPVVPSLVPAYRGFTGVAMPPPLYSHDVQPARSPYMHYYPADWYDGNLAYQVPQAQVQGSGRSGQTLGARGTSGHGGGEHSGGGEHGGGHNPGVEGFHQTLHLAHISGMLEP